MIYCRGCNNELWWEEDTQEDGTTIYYTCMCPECDADAIHLKETVAENIKQIGLGIIALASNVLASGDTKNSKIASHSLQALRDIEQALNDKG